MYYYYPTGTDLVPSFYTDMITLSQTERGIMEFTYDHPGRFLFHAHKVEFSEKGWVGVFLVRDSGDDKGGGADAGYGAGPGYDGLPETGGDGAARETALQQPKYAQRGGSGAEGGTA